MANYAATPLSSFTQARVEFFSRNFAEAERLYRELNASDSTDAPIADAYADIDLDSVLARCEMAAGKPEAAQARLQGYLARARARLATAPKDAMTRYRFAAAEAVAGHSEEALKQLRAAIEAGWADQRSPRVDPRFDSISADPLFKALLADLAVRVTAFSRTVSSLELKSENVAK